MGARALAGPDLAGPGVQGWVGSPRSPGRSHHHTAPADPAELKQRLCDLPASQVNTCSVRVRIFLKGGPRTAAGAGLPVLCLLQLWWLPCATSHHHRRGYVPQCGPAQTQHRCWPLPVPCIGQDPPEKHSQGTQRNGKGLGEAGMDGTSLTC